MQYLCNGKQHQNNEMKHACIFHGCSVEKLVIFRRCLIVIHLDYVYKNVKPKNYLLYYSLKKAKLSMMSFLLLILDLKNDLIWTIMSLVAHVMTCLYALNYRLIVDLELPNDVLGVCFFSQVPDRDVPSLQLVVHVWPVLCTLVLKSVDKIHKYIRIIIHWIGYIGKFNHSFARQSWHAFGNW